VSRLDSVAWYASFLVTAALCGREVHDHGFAWALLIIPTAWLATWAIERHVHIHYCEDCQRARSERKHTGGSNGIA